MDYTTSSEETVYSQTGSMKSFTSALCGSLLVFGAPGSAIAAQQGKQREEFEKLPIWTALKTNEAVVEADYSANAGETLKVVREAFGFNVTEVSEIFGVSRPTVYKWLKGGDVKREVYSKMQALAAVAAHWQQNVGAEGMSFLLDYKGPQADQISIREAWKDEVLDSQHLRELTNTRLAEYKKASVKSTKIIGVAPPVEGDPIDKGTRKLNQLWTENANRLKRSGR